MLPSLARPLNYTARSMIEDWAYNFSTTYPRSFFEKELSIHNWTVKNRLKIFFFNKF